MRFIIQTVNKQCRLDLCQAMQNSVDFDSWRGEKSIEKVVYCSKEDLYTSKKILRYIRGKKDYCPVGTLEFVFAFIDVKYGIDAHKLIKPLNIPKELESYAIGNVYYSDMDFNSIRDGLKRGVRYYAKAMDEFKSGRNGIIDCVRMITPNTQLTEANHYIRSEWRVFVHNGKAIDIRNYSGDPFYFPKLNGDFRDIIWRAAEECGIREGTVDIGAYEWWLDEEKHESIGVIECHDFFSCGLYGFSDYNALPLMLWRTWLKLKRTIESQYDREVRISRNEEGME